MRMQPKNIAEENISTTTATYISLAEVYTALKNGSKLVRSTNGGGLVLGLTVPQSSPLVRWRRQMLGSYPSSLTCSLSGSTIYHFFVHITGGDILL